MIRYSFILMDRLSAFHDGQQLARLLEFLRECGYEGVELNLTEPAGFDLKMLERWLSDIGLQVPSMLTGEAYSEGLCLSSPDSGVQTRTVERLIRYLDIAARFRAILVIGLLQGKLSDEPCVETARKRIIENLSVVAECAEARQVELVVEPVNHLQVGFHNSVAEVRDLVRAIGSTAVKPMVDTIHMNIEESSLVEPILACGAELRHVHLCESNGARFGTGRVDFAAVLRALQEIGYDRFASVKVYRRLGREEAAKTSLEYLRRCEAA